MNLSAINRTISALCSEGSIAARPRLGWKSRTEDELFFEVAVCILSSQTLFELAIATSDNLKGAGLLAASAYPRWKARYEEALCFALAKPVQLETQGVTRTAVPRFRHRAAKHIATTARRIYGEGTTLRQIISAANSAGGARRNLVAAVAGFGPKQASLFLRRIGYCADLAVLDTHILDYLRLAVGISPKPSALSSLRTYEQLEIEFLNHNGEQPNNRAILKAMQEKWPDRKVDNKTLFDLFPGNPSKQAGKIAGLPESMRKGGY